MLRRPWTEVEGFDFEGFSAFVLRVCSSVMHGLLKDRKLQEVSSAASDSNIPTFRTDNPSNLNRGEFKQGRTNTFGPGPGYSERASVQLARISTMLIV